MQLSWQFHALKRYFFFAPFMLGCVFALVLSFTESAHAATLRDDAAGGDCAAIGIWDGGTKTCALTQDIHDSIWIEGNGITLDGGSHSLIGDTTGFGVIIDSWGNNTIKDLTIRNFTYGIYISNSPNNLITNNTISNNTETGIVLSGSRGNHIAENEIAHNSVSGIEIFYVILASENKVYRNNFTSNGYQIFAMFDPQDSFSQTPPLGGNYWDDFDEPAEGCYDANNDNLCDAPRMFQYGEDAYPWTSPSGWLGPQKNHAPIISFPQELEYRFDGIHPNKGTPAALRTFKVIYTDEDNDAPHYVKTVVAADIGRTEYMMSVDTSAPETLKDGNYANGEQYISSDIFPKGTYSYFFEASDASGTSRLPLSGMLNFEAGYSNIAFLPGLEASRLYATDPNCLFLNCENQLWEPNRNDDVRKLYLNSDGTPQNSNIYTHDIIGEAFGFNVYKNFARSMNALVTGGIINEWKALPYDWRFNQIDIARMDISLRGGGIYQMMEEIEKLAQTSGSGKVTLITHSNGGLVGKALISKLRAHARAGIIDKVIMVAAPQIGTPEALMGLLHGGQRGILKGWLPSHETMREMGERMPSTYNLMPSRSYFNTLDTVAQSVIEFSPTSVTAYLRGIYGDAITGFDNLNRFLAGEGGARTEPVPGNVKEPNVLDQRFLDRAQADQAFFGNWELPSGIKLIQIAGWGLDTLRGIRYEEKGKTLCNSDLTICTTEKFIDPQPLFTEDGDKTVVVPSAIAMIGQKFYMNLPDQNFLLRRNREHSDILEVSAVQQLIEKIIKDDTSSLLPDHITVTQPSPNNATKKLRIRVHSPVSLDLYDTEGNHTGIIQNPNSDSDIRLFEEQIPNSYYLEMGEGKYAGSDTLTTTNIVLKGQSLGTFTLEIDEVFGATVTGTLRFNNIPVTENSLITMDIQTIASATPLQVDINSDGLVDFTLSSSTSANNSISLEIFSSIIQNMEIQESAKKKLIKDIKKIQKHLKKEAEHGGGDEENNHEVNEDFFHVEKDVRKFIKKGILSRDDGEKLLQIIAMIKEDMVR